MHSAHPPYVQKRPWLRRAAQALCGLFATGLLLGIGVHQGRTALVEWAGKRAGLDWHINQVEWSMVGRSVELHGLQMKGDSWMATTDTIACTGISWVRGELQVDRIELGALDVTQEAVSAPDTNSSIESGSPLDWETLWTGPLTGVVLNRLDWDQVRVQGNASPALTLGQGTCDGLTCNAHGVDLQEVGWSFVRGHLPTMTVPIELDSSSLHGSWRPEGWDVATSNLSLPGLDVEGTLSWPEMTGRGKAKFEWTNLPHWIHDKAFQGWLDTLRLGGETTVVAWDLNDSLWTATAEGPSWLSFSASGNANAWQGQASVQRIPESLQTVIPSDTLNLRATGTAQTTDIALTGGPELHVHVHATAKSNWQAWLASPGPPARAHAFIDAWGSWVLSPSHRLEARLDSDGDALQWAAGQPDLNRPWSMAGSLEGQALEITATLDGGDADAPKAVEATLSLDLDSAAQIATWHGTCLLDGLDDVLQGNGQVSWRSPDPEWQLSLKGEGARLRADGAGTPALPDVNALLSRSKASLTWGDMRVRGQLAPGSEWASWLMPSATLLDTLFISASMDHTDMLGHLTMPELLLAGRALKGTDLTVIAKDNAVDVSLQSQVLLDSTGEETLALKARLSGRDIWEASLTVQDGERSPFVWRMDAAPTTSNHWDCSILEWNVPTPGSELRAEDTPVQWRASPQNPFPSRISFASAQGALTIQTGLDEEDQLTVRLDGAIDQLNEWTQPLDSALSLSRLELEGSMVWGADNVPSTLLAFHGFDAQYERIQLDNVDVGLSLHRGVLNVFADSRRTATNTSLSSHLAWQPFVRDAHPQLTVNLANLPIEWAQPWLDSTLVHLSGRMDADLELRGTAEQPFIQGEGRVDSLKAEVPNLGTHFGGHGSFQISEGDLWLNNFSLYDARGNMARMEGALVHSNFQDWNFDASIVETPEPLLLMDLPEANNDVAFGQLVVGGSLDLFYWNGELDIKGDLSAHEGTDLHLALLTEESEGWDNTVEFLKPQMDDIEAVVVPVEDNLGVMIDFNLETKRDAKVTILTDPENDANIVGHTEGNLHVRMEDWEHMTLNGELDIVEGRYDLALGSLVRKTFVAKPGGRLFWNGNPYAGTLDLEATYTTRANVQPLLGSGTTQVQNEDVDVLLQLSGPMMTPNLSFDLAAPKAPPLVSEALASAVADPSEKTSQAIALLSLQEFLPPQYNSLELGTNGLQDYTVDVVTSQLSQWLSRFNDDVDIGIRYDAQRTAEEAPTTSQQDALQVALRASFLNDRLEVEGAVGSREITQEALGETHLQNVRVMYHLNEEKSLQLTGFSEAQSSATQTANTTSQGVGIRWHRSFNWKWPWTQKESQD